MTKFKHISLQTKILTLIISLILVVILLLSGIYVVLEKQQTEENKGERALQVSKTVSFMPSVREAFNSENPSSSLQSIAENIRLQVGAAYIVISNADGIRYSHPNPSLLGRTMNGHDNYRALIFGQYYISQSESVLGPALNGKSPIFDDDGNIMGIVSVGFLLEDIHAAIYQKVWDISKISLIVLILGAIGGMLLTKNIRKDTLGLEPFEIANLYRERSAILHSIREGVIAVDENGLITMMNQPASDMLGLYKNYLHEPIEKILPNTLMYRVLESGENEQNQEMYLNNRWVIVNREVIKENEKVIGAVASFRDKTEIQEMVETISEVRQYSEDLRAQTHEYINKLYVLSGLIQLGQYEEAVDMIQSEVKTNGMQNHILFDQIRDSKVQAILLGKIGKASEKKINFSIDQNSSLDQLPDHIDISSLIAILGNIIDNAFEAVDSKEQKEVQLFATDIGNDIIFEVADTGEGIDEDENILKKGFSTKTGGDRGYGLTIVQDTVKKLGGSFEIKSDNTKGTIVTVFVPKNHEGEGGELA
ncbi:two-component system, CitB family, sensor histidine kinase CitS [Lentibacillus halodurans]|uniref:histidine kinase n=1 Tax=Lentibacillus halodurans TaxID=237679 RepID=A0A1I0Z8H3_9BACI|nr:sensor histidine kinase [Lentibacillus halodurans]SFB21702.1 two-component system, CitB family, sensor histidine kinase CitS [Lentibacillus halodurans]